MIYIVCIVILLLLFVLMVLFRKEIPSAGRRHSHGTSNASEPVSGTETSVCCGKHAVCEKQKLTEAMMNKAGYFDDEELDRFKGKDSSEYTDSEIEEFRYILYTMQQPEVTDWLDSLQVREIEFPDALKEEAFSLMNEGV